MRPPECSPITSSGISFTTRLDLHDKCGLFWQKERYESEEVEADPNSLNESIKAKQQAKETEEERRNPFASFRPSVSGMSNRVDYREEHIFLATGKQLLDWTQAIIGVVYFRLSKSFGA